MVSKIIFSLVFCVSVCAEDISTIQKRDARVYQWPTNQVEIDAKALPIMAFPSGEIYNVKLVQPDPHWTTLEWYQKGTCMGWTVLESNNLKDWTTNKTVWCEYINKNFAKRAQTFTTNNPVFWKVEAFNF